MGNCSRAIRWTMYGELEATVVEERRMPLIRKSLEPELQLGWDSWHEVSRVRTRARTNLQARLRRSQGEISISARADLWQQVAAINVRR